MIMKNSRIKIIMMMMMLLKSKRKSMREEKNRGKISWIGWMG